MISINVLLAILAVDAALWIGLVVRKKHLREQKRKAMGVEWVLKGNGYPFNKANALIESMLHDLMEREAKGTCQNRVD